MRKFDKGGIIHGPQTMAHIIPWSKRHEPIPADWDPRYTIAAEECIINRDMRCVRSDHPHREAK